jgi:hypothetical protein
VVNHERLDVEKPDDVLLHGTGQVRYDRTDDRPIDIVLVEAGMAHQAVQNDEVFVAGLLLVAVNPKRLHPPHSVMDCNDNVRVPDIYCNSMEPP